MNEFSRLIDSMVDAGRLNFGQHENGLYWAELRDEDGLVESATLRKTLAEIFSWIIDLI